MAWVEIVTLLALIELIVFSVLVGRARGTYGVAAPATTGNPIFERYYRVQANTIETLLVFLPALWIASRYWSPRYVALIGVVYLIGRIVYLFGYVRDPRRRGAGYALSMLPVIVLIITGLVGAIKALLR
jgi:glutathione S-transferase